MRGNFSFCMERPQNGDFPFMHGGFMSILKGRDSMFEWDLPVSEWEGMARRPFTGAIQR
jgi:hypothetical protein